MSFISIVVLTYNHERCIKKCLDSLLQSITENVELIVTDDASKDRTTEIVTTWFSEHGNKFRRVELLLSDSNMGTIKNLIKGVNAASSPFIKDIAGDDWFLPKAIDNINEFCASSAVFDAAFSPCAIAYEETDAGVRLNGKYENAASDYNFWSKNKYEQLRALCRKNCLKSPGAFYTRKFWDCLDLDNYGVVLVEDWTMWLLGAIHNQKYVEMKTPVVAYRQSLSSVSKNFASSNYSQYLEDCARIIKNISLNVRELPIEDKLYLIFTYCYIKIFLLLPVGMKVMLAKLRSNKNKEKNMVC